MKIFVIILNLILSISLFAQEEPVCKITSFCYEVDECTSDSTYRIFLNFSAKDQSDWTVEVNGEEEFNAERNEFSESLILNSRESNIIRVVSDADEACFVELTLPPYDCSAEEDCDECRIWDLFAEATRPNDDCEYYIEFEFNYECNEDEFFGVRIYGEVLFELEYGERYYRIGPFNTSDGDIEILLRDLELRDCHSDEFLVEAPECENEELCNIYDLEVTIGDIINDSSYYITINFLHENTNPAGFDLFWDHEIFGFYSYADLPLTLLVETRGLEYEFLRVSDNDNEDCHAEIEFKSPVFTGINEQDHDVLYTLEDDQIRIDWTKVISADLYDIMGRKLITLSDNQNIAWPTSSYNIGLYFLKVQTLNSASKTFKIPNR